MKLRIRARILLKAVALNPGAGPAPLLVQVVFVQVTPTKALAGMGEPCGTPLCVKM